MSNFDTVLTHLRQERDRINQAIAALEGVSSNGSRRGLSGKRTISAAGRARIAAAQRARWAKVKGQPKIVSIARKSKAVKRTMSAFARKRIAAAQRARWAAYRKQKKSA